jgi:hypothetical protein
MQKCALNRLFVDNLVAKHPYPIVVSCALQVSSSARSALPAAYHSWAAVLLSTARMLALPRIHHKVP